MRLKCNAKPHECDVCEKLFNNYAVMVVHKRGHFGERPYKCKDCGERFVSASALRTHGKLHKQHNLHLCDNDDLATTLKHDETKTEQTSFKRNRRQLTCSGKCFHSCCFNYV